MYAGDVLDEMNDQGPDGRPGPRRAPRQVGHQSGSVTDPRFLIPLALFLLAIFVITLAWRSNSVGSDETAASTGDALVDDVRAAEARAGFGNVVVREEGGLIVLEGQAQTSTDAAAIGAVARSVEGVSSVDNRLVIVGGAIELPSTTIAATAAPADTGASPLASQLADVGRVTFESGSASLTAEGLKTVDAAARILVANPGVRIEIHGHTDASGDTISNEALSQSRAEAVLDALVIRGVDGQRLTAIGFGESQPVAPNITDDGRAENRRIEFIVAS